MAEPLTRRQRKQRSALLRPDLQALRLESDPVPTTVPALAKAVCARWRADATGALIGWGWPQVHAYRRLFLLMQEGRADG